MVGFSLLSKRQCTALTLDNKRCERQTRSLSGRCSKKHLRRPAADIKSNHQASSSQHPPITTNLPLRPGGEPVPNEASGVREEVPSDDPGTSVDPTDIVGEGNNTDLPPLPKTPKRSKMQSNSQSTPVIPTSGSKAGELLKARRTPMTAGLVGKSYTSPELLDKFLEDVPEVSEELIRNLRNAGEWTAFINSCSKKGKGGSPPLAGSNEEEFRELIKCTASLDSLRHCKPRPGGQIRISWQGDRTMSTWNPNAKWMVGDYAPTEKNKELKPDFMSLVVKVVQPGRVEVAAPETILPPPKNWTPEQMEDDEERFPTVQCKEPLWECLDVFWELKRNSHALTSKDTYVDCGLKAAEALRHQWSRRYIYCFLHCGTEMQLLHFDRAGLLASKLIDIKENPGTFMRCLRAIFYHEPTRLGYPGKDAPVQRVDSDGRLLQVVTVGGRELYIDEQITGPRRDHLISRATTVFRAKLVNPASDEETGWNWCYKSSWVQKSRRHEGYYLDKLQNVSGVVDKLAHGAVVVEEKGEGEEERGLDTTTNGRRRCLHDKQIPVLKKGRDPNPNPETDTKTTIFSTVPTTSKRDDLAVPNDEDGPDNREHRDVVTAWVDWSFDEAVSSLKSVEELPSMWRQAFEAVKSITEKRVVHRDMSFRNIRVDKKHNIKVCDFDMAMLLDDDPTGARDRTGTTAFMAVSMFNTQAPVHRPVHDCESVFWLCALDLLRSVGFEDVQNSIRIIKSPGSTMAEVKGQKGIILNILASLEKDASWLESYFLATPRTLPFLFCLIDLAKEFTTHRCALDFKGAEEFEAKCFDRCIEIIERELGSGDPPDSDEAVQEVGEEFAGMDINDEENR